MNNPKRNPVPEKYETIKVDSRRVACDGGKGAQGHPRVFLQMKPDENSVMCPYCSRNYVLKG